MCHDARVIDASDVVPDLPRPDDGSDAALDDAPGTAPGVEGDDAEQEPEPEQEPAEPPSPRRIPPAALVALGVVTAVARWVFAANRTVYQLAPDEPGTLAMARFLAGGTRWNMFDHATWRPGLATLMAPLYWLTGDATTILHGGYLINAALAGIAAVILARLGLRITRLSPAACVVVAGAIAVAPSSLSASAHVWGESLVTVLILTVVWWLLELYDEPRLAPGLIAIVAVVAGYVSHSRMLPLVPVVMALVIGLHAWRRRWRDTAISIAVAGAAFGLGSAYCDWIFSSVWDSPASNNTVGTVVDHLSDPDGIARSTLGQVWYQLVATAGVFGIGAGVLIGRAVRRRRDGDAPPIPRDARLLVLTALPLVAASILFMAGRTRTDHRIYGRYNDAVVWPILLVGAGWLLAELEPGRRWRQLATRVAVAIAVGGAIVGGGYGVVAAHGDALAGSVGVRPMIAGLLPYLGDRGTIPAVRLSVLAAIVLGVVLAATWFRDRRWLAVLTLVLAGVVGWSGWRAHHALGIRLNTWQAADAVREVDAEHLIPAGADIGFRFVPDADKPAANVTEQRRRAQLYQMYLPDHEFLRDRGTDDAVGPYVFAPVDDPEMREAGATELWRDPRVKIALWREPA